MHLHDSRFPRFFLFLFYKIGWALQIFASNKLCCMIAGHLLGMSMERAMGFGNIWEPSLLTLGPAPSAQDQITEEQE